ncbi:MAG: VOC family protein [Chloroflexia bacterium]
MSRRDRIRARAETDGYSALADPRVEPELAFQRVAEVKTVKNRVHLDLQVENLDREVERLLSVGAVRAEGYPQTMGAVVLRDPEGNEFCVLG